MALTPITVTGTFTAPDNSPMTGRLIATLSATIVNGVITVVPSPEHALIVAGQLLAASGAPFVLLANDDAGTMPAASTYLFTVLVDDVPVREFRASIPSASAGGTVDFSQLEPEAT
jgi:hypothetical protein